MLLRFAKKLFQQLMVLLVIVITAIIVTIFGLYFYHFPQLPSVATLQDIQLKQPIRIYSREDKLIAEFGEYRRRLVKIDDVPDKMINAFIAIEDARFYRHEGIDFIGIIRAISVALRNKEITQGASTITMQLARNYFLTSERTFDRKVKEIFLAIKIETRFTKEEILALYLNKIFLGNRAYGVGAAAEVYYGKKLHELSLAQTAMIAGLPKAPTKYNPISNPHRAKQRRDYILQRMLEQRYINQQQYTQAINEAVSAKVHYTEAETYAPYMAEMVRTEALKRYGDEAYKLGLHIYTTLDSNEQALALSTLRDHLSQYSHRHGYHGAEGRVDLSKITTKEQLFDTLSQYKTYGDFYPAVVVDVNRKQAMVRINQQEKAITLTLNQMRWARRYISENRRGRRIRRVSDVLKQGDIIRIQQNDAGQWQLTQIPRVTGSLVSLDAHDGAIRAIVGGFDFAHSQFNRAIQAKRQPGSSFKPFIYSAALAKGASPASIVNDAPFRQAGSSWNPQNFGRSFSGLTRLRVALAKSKNLVAIHTLKKIGVDYAIDYATQFGFKKENLPYSLTIALGTGVTSPLEMATAYASFANGGYQVENYFIRKIENNKRDILFRASPKIICLTCENTDITAKRIMQPHVNYQITSMLQSVTQNGTAAQAGRVLKRTDIAGKTGTTNDQKDAWFAGFTPNKVTTVWMGFDNSQPLGRQETATKAALPIWIDFMQVALKEQKVSAFPRPDTLIDVTLDARTGSQPTRFTHKTIVESLIPEQIPAHTTRYNVQMVKHDNNSDSKDREALPTNDLELIAATTAAAALPAQQSYLSQQQKRLQQKRKWQQQQRLRAKQAARKAARLKKLREKKRKRAQLKRKQAKVAAQQRRLNEVEIPEQLF